MPAPPVRPSGDARPRRAASTATYALMPAPRPSPHALLLAWLVALLVLACHPSSGPVTPLAPPAPRAVALSLPPPPPVSLTASDGTGLGLVSLRARAVLDDPFALTELELEFENPRSEIIEGRFELLLPPGARVTRFALQVEGKWREAEVVERLAARQVYEVALYAGLDPALLERDTGNRFGARVFPIEPYGRKRILVSYVEEFADPTEPWRLGVRGLPAIETLELEALVVDPTGGTRRSQRSLPWEAPTADFVVPRGAPSSDGVRHGEQVTARIQPLADMDLGLAEPLEQLTVLVDTSASRALDFDASLLGLHRVLQALGRHAGTAKLRVLAFDQEVVPIYSGSLLGFGPEALAALHARRPLGASDLGLALRALEDGEHPRVLLVSDGLVSLGEESDAALRRQLQALAARGVERLDALVLGRVRDEQRLQRLVTGPLPRAGVLLRAELPPERAAARLVQPTLEGVRLSVPGARWWSPTRLDGLQPDDHVLVFAELPAHVAEDQLLRVQVSGPVHRDLEVPLRSTESPLHEQGWRRAQIEGLVTRLAALQDELESARLRRHVIELSVRHRIVNDLTALLVLESDEDYARFGLDRRALEDILTVGLDGAALLDRRASEPLPPTTTTTGHTTSPPSTATGPGKLTGVVRNRDSRAPIVGALVVLQCTCLPSALEVVTSGSGLYVFEDLPAGTYTVQALYGQADVSKVFDLPNGARFRANFEIDPDSEFRRLVRVAPRHASRWTRGRAGRGKSKDDTDTSISYRFGAGSKPEAPPPPVTKTPPVLDPVEEEEETQKQEPLAEPPSGSPGPPVPEPMGDEDGEPEPMGGDDGGSEAEATPEEPDAPTLVDVTKAPEPIFDRTTTARVVTMEEFRNVPVGGQTGRDFTAVVDSTPTASYDSVGISLAGTTGAESKYTVEGASFSSSPSRPMYARVHLQQTTVTGPDIRRRSIHRSLRHQLDAVHDCYYRALALDSTLRGRLEVRLELRDGRVINVGKREQVGLEDPELLRCLDRALREWQLPSQARSLTQVLVFRPNDGPPTSFWYDYELEPEPTPATSPFPEIQGLIARGERGRALALASDWRERAPVDVLALAALGDAARARGDLRRAARAYASIIDLYPSRADMLRFAAALLEATGDPAALDVAIDAYRRAVAQRPDHPTGSRNLALALLRRGEPLAAFEVLEQALGRPYPSDRFAGIHRVLQADLGIAAAVWLHREPTHAATIHARLAALGVPLATAPSLRMVLTWESDLSDVDLHVTDAQGGQAFSQQPVLPSGELVADVNNGFGPECFVVPDPAPDYWYSLRVHYYWRGPMGYGMGKVAVLHHDGAGGLQFEDRPFVALEDDAWLQVGELSQAGPIMSLR